VKRRDLSVAHFDRTGVFSFVVDVMVTVVLDVCAYEALRVVMMLGFRGSKGGLTGEKQAENHNEGRQKVGYALRLHN
jgi:hypothetical protein